MRATGRRSVVYSGGILLVHSIYVHNNTKYRACPLMTHQWLCILIDLPDVIKVFKSSLHMRYLSDVS